ncbi:MAG: hypothetical protein ACRC6M_05220, partial [Microcystaceae cyanobacterium]
VLATAADLNAAYITPEVLQKGLATARGDQLRQAALTVQEERIRQLLQKRGNLSDETMTIDDLKSLNLQSFSEMLPFLERLEEADLAQRLPQADATVYEPILLPPGDENP